MKGFFGVYKEIMHYLGSSMRAYIEVGLFFLILVFRNLSFIPITAVFCFLGCQVDNASKAQPKPE
jgi:hypothetical protein